MTTVFEVSSHEGMYDRDGFEGFTDYNYKTYRSKSLEDARKNFEAEKTSRPTAYFERMGSVTRMIRSCASLFSYKFENSDQAESFLAGDKINQWSGVEETQIELWQNTPDE